MSKEGLTSDDEEYRFTEVADARMDPYGQSKKPASKGSPMLSLVIVLVLVVSGYKFYQHTFQKKQDTFAPVESVATKVEPALPNLPQSLSLSQSPNRRLRQRLPLIFKIYLRSSAISSPSIRVK